MEFPLGWPSGNRIPVSEQIPGRSFRLRRHPETTSQSEPIFRDTLSAKRHQIDYSPDRCKRPHPAQSSILRGAGLELEQGHGQLKLNRHRIYVGLRHCAENPRVRFANPHRLRPPAGVLARSLQTLRVCLTPAPCTEFDSPRYGLEIKRQVDMSIYLPVTYGGGAENRTPVHESPLIGISKLSRWFSLGRFARSNTLAAY